MTEEKNESSENQDLAQEALDATDDTTSSADEPTVPLHKHTALRQRAQAAEVEAARAQGELTGLKQAQADAAPGAKDPLQVETERQAAEGIAEEDMTISPAVYRKHEQHMQQVANATAKATAEKQLRLQQGASKTKAMAAHEDFNDVILAGQNHLTPGELVDLENAGVDFGELCYSKCQEAAARATPKTETKTEEPAPETENKSESEAEEKVQSQAEILKGLDEEADPDTVRAMSL